ncbi:MAG TPA: Z1 domain-containing protein [Gemmataceae bacterium]|nr:Z1 domain-containing protein [Gemmataceae bacterium]
MSNGDHDGPMIVDILAEPAGGGWDPQPGPETNGLSLPAHARDHIVSEAQRILRRCIAPGAVIQNQTGLVVGYVQSGKTTSFTTVAALARDNGYRMVILIAGTKDNLFSQNRDRLIDALRLECRPRNNPWQHISQPKIRDESHVAIRETLLQWESPTASPVERRTIVITVMKQHQHLQNLIDVLRQVDLQHATTLIIDDEGDQAGLNTLVNQGEESTTYRRLLALKVILSRHSYLQYTATPQAPLLINIVDVLSPDFAEILTPGDGYIGGAEYFIRRPNLIRDIPVAQIQTPNNPLNAPPPTLLDAMRLYFTGVAIGLITGQPDQNCSMMVHPSQKTDPQRQLYNWVSATRELWRQTIDLPDDEQDKIDLINLFRAAYDDLVPTVENIPPFDQVRARLRQAISQTYIREVNTRGRRRTPQINWGENYAWILVGGQAMERGFTVEGLTVTYMPRGLGMRNADTVQQRARFFGYKRDYVGLCRVFVGPDVRRAFRDYVEHEEDIRLELRQFSNTGRPLVEWRREFFLPRPLRPTRHNVIDIPYMQIRFGDTWIHPKGPHDSADALAANRTVFEQFQAAHAFGPYEGLDLRQASDRNLVLRDASLQAVHEELLTRYRVTRLEDSQQMVPLLRLIQLHLIEQPDALCTVFLMAGGRRRRRDYTDDRVQPFQGPQYATQNGQRVRTYPGDAQVRDDQCLTVQMYYLDIGTPNDLIAENVPLIAVRVPVAMGRDTLIQPQGGGA